MKIPLRILFTCFLVIMFHQGAHAQDKKSNPSDGRAPEEASAEPDHLLPVGKTEEWDVTYFDQLRKKLDLDAAFFCRMVVKPSFDPEHVVSLEGESGKQGKLEESEKLILRYSVGDSSIYYSLPENNPEQGQKDVRVETKKVVFPAALGIRLSKLWDRMVGQVRNPEVGSGGLDGTTYEFETGKGRGEVWSPQLKNSPQLLVEVGASLVDYCKAPEEKKAEALKDIDTKIGNLEKYLDEHQAASK